MAETIHVSGEAHIRVAVPSGTTLASLGYSVNGVTIELERRTAPVMADTGGGEEGVPVDFQSMGRIARVRAQLVIYDEAVLAPLRKLADETNEGELETIGYLLGANSKLNRLLITSPSEALPWNFPTGFLTGAQEVKIGTRRTAWDINWFAFAYIGAGTSVGKVLYNRVTT